MEANLGTCPPSRDENRSDTDGYHRYYICFYISVQIRIRTRIVSTMSDRIRLDIDIINMRFEYSDTDTVSDVEHPDSDTDRSEPSKRIRTRIRSENIRRFRPVQALQRKPANQTEAEPIFNSSSQTPISSLFSQILQE